MKKKESTRFLNPGTSCPGETFTAIRLSLDTLYPRLCLCLLLMVVSVPSLLGQNVLDKAGLDATSPASAAYSTRKLSTAYSGDAIRVRRSSDNTTQDIGFTAGGDLNTAALTSFVGVYNAYVTIWYDQSGNARDLTQVNNDNQPRIVNTGTLETENSRPFIRFFTNVATNVLRLATVMTTTGHVAVVNKFVGGGDGFILGNQNNYKWHSDNGGYKLFSAYSSGSIQNSKVWQNGISIPPMSAVWNTVLMVNSIAPQSPSVETDWDNIGQDRVYHQLSLGGGYAELIVFATELNSSARVALANNQGIYNNVSAFSFLNKLGQFTNILSNAVNHNGAIGISKILPTGEILP